MTVDPLSEIVTLLQPSASFSKLVEYAGRWRIRRDVEGKPVYFAVLEGECRVIAARRPPIIVRAGDFVLSPSTNDQIIESIDAPPQGIDMLPVELGEGRFRVGPHDGPINLKMQVGLCSFVAWRMAIAKRLLRTREFALPQVAARVGYGSASTFSTAFARHVGMPPARYARDEAAR